MILFFSDSIFIHKKYRVLISVRFLTSRIRIGSVQFVTSIQNNLNVKIKTIKVYFIFWSILLRGVLYRQSTGRFAIVVVPWESKTSWVRNSGNFLTCDGRDPNKNNNITLRSVYFPDRLNLNLITGKLMSQSLRRLNYVNMTHLLRDFFLSFDGHLLKKLDDFWKFFTSASSTEWLRRRIGKLYETFDDEVIFFFLLLFCVCTCMRCIEIRLYDFDCKKKKISNIINRFFPYKTKFVPKFTNKIFSYVQ